MKEGDNKKDNSEKSVNENAVEKKKDEKKQQAIPKPSDLFVNQTVYVGQHRIVGTKPLPK